MQSTIQAASLERSDVYSKASNRYSVAWRTAASDDVEPSVSRLLFFAGGVSMLFDAGHHKMLEFY
jgi:hypothetical protein